MPLQAIPKYFVVFSAVVYGIGMLTVNAWLGKYGYYSFNLLRVNYLTAGLWTLFPLVIYAAAGYVKQIYRSREELTGGWKGAMTRATSTMVLLLSFFVVIHFQLRPYGFTFVNRDWTTVFFYTTFLIVASYFMIGEEMKREHWSFKYADLFVLSVFALTYILLFGTKGYGQIPMRFGGGKPVTVRLLLTEEGARHLGTVYETTSSGSAITDPVGLLLETNDAYVVLVGESAVSVRRDLVSLAVYLPDNKPQKGK